MTIFSHNKKKKEKEDSLRYRAAQNNPGGDADLASHSQRGALRCREVLYIRGDKAHLPVDYIAPSVCENWHTG